MIEDFIGGGSSIFSNRVNDDESYLYHYTSASTLAKILESRQLRMGPYSRTNDPRETSEWNPTIDLDEGDEDLSSAELNKMFHRIGDIRDGVKLACFTLDSEIDQPQFRLPFHRGWARARMWHQYANGHSGVCLILDRARWNRDLRTMGENKSAAIYEGPVRYEDATLGQYQSLLTFSSTELRTGESNKSIKRILDGHGQELFFLKNRDWESETEYRFLAVSDSPEEYVSVSSSLVGIVLGQDFPSTEFSVLGDRLRRNGFSTVRCAHLHWSNGAPLVFVDQDLAGLNLLVIPPANLTGDPSKTTHSLSSTRPN